MLLRLLLILLFIPTSLLAKDYDVRDYGAKADGTTLDTKAVQRAIDQANAAGGGRVLIPAGKQVLIGTIYLKSYVTLHLENGATLLGSPNIEDYTTDTHRNLYKNEPHMDRCLIFAADQEHFAIDGYGTIDANGHFKNFTSKTGRPMMIRFLRCNDIRMRDVTLRNPAAWTSAWLYCNEIVVDGIRIHSRANNNGDGLDFDGCTNVRVSNSSFDTSDDSICLQASMPEYPCKNIVVTNCTFTSKWAGMRIGLLSRGDIESVTVSNCTFNDIDDSGLKIQLNEGGTMKNMTFTNLTMKNVPRPVFMTFAQQRAFVDSPEEMYPMKEMSTFTFQNLVADNRALDQNSAFFLTGMPGHNIANVVLKDIQFTVAGGGTQAEADRKQLPEYTLETLEGWWPEFHLVGTLPAAGVYLRHMENVFIDNFQLHTVAPDARPSYRFDDVERVTVRDFFLNGVLVK